MQQKLDAVSVPFHMSSSHIRTKEATRRPKTAVISEMVEMAADPDFSGVEAGVTTTVPESLDGVGTFTSGAGAEGDPGARATQS